MKIARIGIKNMYNLKNLNLDFGDYYALVVGPNGCGKTNIIKCVEKAIKLAIRDIDHNRVEDLINYEQSDGENSFIRLDFKLNSTEISKLLKLRMISIVERTIRLCRLLLPAREQRILADLERIFLQKTVPLLLENLRSTIKDLKKWKSKDADVVISYVDAGLHFFEATTNFLKIHLPDRREKEKKIISNFLKEKFDNNVLQRKLRLKKTPQNEDEFQVHEVLDDILNHDQFLRLNGTRRDAYGVSEVYGEISFDVNKKELMTLLDDVRQDKTLNQTIRKFLEQGSTCVLPQSRGYGEAEQGDRFWNLKTAEERIVKAYLSKQGSEEYNVLNKIKEAMLFIAGLELDVAQDSSANVTFLRECNQSQAEWRRLSDVSGGQRELLMVLSTVHLSGVDNVFLDEPGHSLHPPKQAQLRRWLETKREPGQVLFVITHSTDMISPNWLGALYHMHADEDKYSASCLRGLSRDKPSGEAVKRQDHGDGVGTSSSIHQSSSNIPFDEIVSSGGEKIENEEDFNLDRIVGSKSPSYSKDIDGNGPPSKKQRISDGTRLKLEIKVGPEMIDFLMGVEMRRLFFSSGAIFVEGDTDRRIIQALRAVELDKVNDTMNGRDCSLQKWHDAVKETQMDRWDIIPIYGSANWLKAYTAAKDLKIPFVVVLDADVLNKKIGSAIHPITFENWNRCRLKETVERSRYPNNHPLNTMVEKVEELTKDRSNKGQLEIRVRKEIANYNLWVWPEGDLEDLFFKNEQVKNGLVQNEQFISKIEELGVKQPREINSGRNPMPADSAEENFRQHVDYFKSLVEEIKLIFERKLEEVEEKPLDTDIVESLANDKRLASFYGTVKQKCKNHVSFVKAGTKVVMTDTEEDIPNYLDAKWKRFWECAKKKLHDEGNWKSISFELLKDMVKIAVNQVDHPLHALWEHIKNQMVTDNTKVQIPPNLLREKIDSMLH